MMDPKEQDEICRIAGYGIVHSVIKQKPGSKPDGSVFYTKCGYILYENPRMHTYYGTRYCRTELPVSCKNCLRVVKKSEKAADDPSHYIAILDSDTPFRCSSMANLLSDLRGYVNNEEELIRRIETKELIFFKAQEIKVGIDIETTRKITHLVLHGYKI